MLRICQNTCSGSARLFVFKLIYHLSASLNEKTCSTLTPALALT